MMHLGDLATLALTHAGATLNRQWVLPIAVVFPTGRCNSRCVSCGWWQTDGAGELTAEEFEGLACDLRAMGTRLVVLSGGEPLLRPDIWRIAESFRARGMRLHLLTSGLALARDAGQAARYFDRIVVSLDGASAEQYRAIRGVDGLSLVAAGVSAVRAVDPRVRITARATVHKLNYRQLIDLVDTARLVGVQQVSFLAADLTSTAFGPRTEGDLGRLALDEAEVEELRALVERCIEERAGAFAGGFVAESPDRLRRLPEYYAARLGLRPFPGNACNAPSVSVVIEADGTVRPCFFHAPVGNTRDEPLARIVAGRLREFRAAWRPASDAVCQRCVCTLNLGWGTPPWA